MITRGTSHLRGGRELLSWTFTYRGHRGSPLLLFSWTKGWAARECDMKVSWREQNRSFKFHYSKDDARRCLPLHATCYIFSERECRLIISQCVSITLDEVRKKMYNFFQFRKFIHFKVFRLKNFIDLNKISFLTNNI